MIDYTLPLGQVRLLTSDVDETNPLLTDAQINGFLTLQTNTFRAAALALHTIATSEVLLSKKIRMQNGTSTDGPAVAAELRALAATLEARADVEDQAAQESFFEIVPMGEDHAEAAEWRIL